MNPSFGVGGIRLSVMAQGISSKDKLEKSIKNALTGAYARNTIGLPCLCERITSEITITSVLPENSNELNIDRWTEVQGTTKATVKIAKDISEENIAIDFIMSTENCKVIFVKSILAQTSTIVYNN